MNHAEAVGLHKMLAEFPALQALVADLKARIEALEAKKTLSLPKK